MRLLHAFHLRDNSRTRLVQPIDGDSDVDILRLKRYLILVMVDLVDFDRTFEDHCDILGSGSTLVLYYYLYRNLISILPQQSYCTHIFLTPTTNTCICSHVIHYVHFILYHVWYWDGTVESHHNSRNHLISFNYSSCTTNITLSFFC